LNGLAFAAGAATYVIVGGKSVVKREIRRLIELGEDELIFSKKFPKPQKMNQSFLQSVYIEVFTYIFVVQNVSASNSHVTSTNLILVS
jgi:hypothetical protein